MTKKKTKAVTPPRDIEPLDPNQQPPAAPRQRGPHHKLRFTKKEVPAGYIRHRGKRDPIGNSLARVHLIILVTVEPPTYGFAGPRQVHPEEWTIPQSEPGSIAYYQRGGTAPAHARMFHRSEPSAAP